MKLKIADQILNIELTKVPAIVLFEFLNLTRKATQANLKTNQSKEFFGTEDESEQRN